MDLQEGLLTFGTKWLMAGCSGSAHNLFGKVLPYPAASARFSEAVEDEVALDLVYEARDIDQRLGSEEKIDAWFEAKTKRAQRLAEG